METIRSIFFICLLLQIVEYAMPSGTYGKYVKFYGGVVIIVLLLNPLVSFLLDGNNIDKMVGRFYNESRMTSIRNDISNNREKTIEKVVKPYADEIRQHVEDVVSQKGLVLYDCQVTFDVDSTSSTFGTIKNIKVIVQSKYDNISYIPESINIQMNEINKQLCDFYNLKNTNINVTIK